MGTQTAVTGENAWSDIVGPFHTLGFAAALMDYFSKCPEVAVVSTITQRSNLFTRGKSSRLVMEKFTSSRTSSGT